MFLYPMGGAEHKTTLFLNPIPTMCHAQLLAVAIHVIWLVGFSVEVVLPSLVR